MALEVNAMQWEHNGYLIRPAEAADAENYFHALFDPLDAEVAYLTGSQTSYPKETVVPFFLRCVADESRYDFLIIAPQGKIIGESVFNEYDPASNSANYRIAISGSEHRDKGLGTWAVRCACAFSFEQLHLSRLTLEVLDCNPRARHVYEKCGFAPFSREEDGLLMEMTHQMWLELR